MSDYSALVQLVRRQALVAFNAHGSSRLQLAYRRNRQSRVVVVRAPGMHVRPMRSAVCNNAGANKLGVGTTISKT